jgi:hypothetical protein
MTTADQTIYHDDGRPSRVDLPMVPADELEDNVIDGAVP